MLSYRHVGFQFRLIYYVFIAWISPSSRRRCRRSFLSAPRSGLASPPNQPVAITRGGRGSELKKWSIEPFILFRSLSIPLDERRAWRRSIFACYNSYYYFWSRMVKGHRAGWNILKLPIELWHGSFSVERGNPFCWWIVSCVVSLESEGFDWFWIHVCFFMKA